MLTRLERVNLGTLLLIPHRALETEVLATLERVGHGDLTLAQSRVLRRIGPDGSRLTDLADQAQVTKQAAGVLVDQLQRTGYVERVPDPSDGRARRVVLTDRGWQACAVVMRTVAEIEARWADHLGDDMPALRRALTRLREITDPYAT